MSCDDVRNGKPPTWESVETEKVVARLSCFEMASMVIPVPSVFNNILEPNFSCKWKHFKKDIMFFYGAFTSLALIIKEKI